MKNLLIFTILTMLFIGCEGEQPLDLTEDESQALAPESATTILQLVPAEERFLAQWADENPFVLPSENTQMVTPVGVPTEVYVVEQGILTKREKIFQKEMYHLLWCYLNGSIVLVNVLDNQIRYISPDEDWEHIKKSFGTEKRKKLHDELYKKWIEGKAEVPPETFEGLDNYVDAAFSQVPFYTLGTLEAKADIIEVVIKHQFLYKVGRNNDREKVMLFVDVKKNITRPHITFPRPLSP